MHIICLYIALLGHLWRHLTYWSTCYILTLACHYQNYLPVSVWSKQVFGHLICKTYICVFNWDNLATRLFPNYLIQNSVIFPICIGVCSAGLGLYICFLLFDISFIFLSAHCKGQNYFQSLYICQVKMPMRPECLAPF